MAKGNDGNYLQHSIEIETATRLAKEDGEGRLHISLTHGMRPYEPLDEPVPGQARRLLESALTAASQPPTPDEPPVVTRYRETGASTTRHGSVYVGVVPSEQILDAAACFQVLDHAKQMKCAPIVWNHWERLPADSARLATLMMGRAIECCAPVVISDGDRIHELVELANRPKIPVRRVIESSGEAIVDLGYAWGLDNAFKMVTKHLAAGMARRALNQYRSLGTLGEIEVDQLAGWIFMTMKIHPASWSPRSAGSDNRRLRCAVTRRHSSAGANPGRPQSENRTEMVVGS